MKRVNIYNTVMVDNMSKNEYSTKKIRFFKYQMEWFEENNIDINVFIRFLVDKYIKEGNFDRRLVNRKRLLKKGKYDKW